MMSHLKMLLIFIGIGIVPAYSVKSQDSHYYWQYYIVDDRGRVGTNTTLLYGTDGLAQISYREADGKEHVRHARQMGSSWQITTVDPGAFLGGGKVSMAINNANIP